MWSRFLADVAPDTTKVVLLMGPAAQIRIGDMQHASDIVSYERVGWLDVYRVPSGDSRLIAALPKLDLVVFGLDWLSDGHIILPNEMDSRKLLVTVHYADLAARSATVALDEAVDTWHQYLRARALSMGISLVYDTSDIDWYAVLAREAGLPGDWTATLPASRVSDDNQVLVWSGDDSEVRILAANPRFDYTAAVADTLVLPRLPTASQEITDLEEEEEQTLTFEQVLQRVQNGQEGDVNIPDGPELAELVGKGEGDNKQAIGEFFRYLVRRTT